MSRFDGRMGYAGPKMPGQRNKGVMAMIRAEKRTEAEERNSANNPIKRVCGHVHGMDIGCAGLGTPRLPRRR